MKITNKISFIPLITLIPTISIFLTLSISSITTHATQTQGEIILKINGDFSTPISIWINRWEKYNGHKPTPPSNDYLNSLKGFYRQSNNINGFPSWTQIGGNSTVWFGDNLNPHSSFDAWYIGNPHIVSAPQVRHSIPRLPTFIPNNLERGGDNLNPTIRNMETGVPVASFIFLTHEQIDEIEINTRNPPNHTQENTAPIKQITNNGNIITIKWLNNNHIYSIHKSTNLVEWIPIIENLTSVNQYIEYHIKANTQIKNQFFKIVFYQY